MAVEQDLEQALQSFSFCIKQNLIYNLKGSRSGSESGFYNAYDPKEVAKNINY
jgi:hypothetical protein